MEKSPAKKWQGNITEYRKKCQKILLLSKSIRYVGLINKYGRTMTGIIRPGTNVFLKAGQAGTEFFLVSTLLSMRQENNSAIGMMDFAIFKHLKVTLVAFQRKEGTYYVSFSKNMTLASLLKIIGKIKKLI